MSIDFEAIGELMQGEPPDDWKGSTVDDAALKVLVEEIRDAARVEMVSAAQYRSAPRPNNYTRELIRVHDGHRAMLESVAARLSALVERV